MLIILILYLRNIYIYQFLRGDHCHDRMVVECATTYASSAYHHLSCEFESSSWRGVLDTTLCDIIFKWLMAGRLFTSGTLFCSTNKTDHHYITKILLKVALNTINPLHTTFVILLHINQTLTRISFQRCSPRYMWWLAFYLCGNTCMTTSFHWEGKQRLVPNNTSLTTSLPIEVPVPSLEIERSCVDSIDFAFVTAII